ncbi:unnamed protein product [Porites lobata]|uniref:Uncharacterized protein n=1 Tax=Porites lobata TaxID=104759 RepID=A0ABN8RDY6_9CNID|nr:unnamed protein product [Porites lobata]
MGGPRSMLKTALVRFGHEKTHGYSSPSKVPKKKKKPTKENMAEKEDGKRKDYHYYHYCPMDGCTSLVKRMPPHLKKVHKLLPDSTEYKAALSRVRGPVSDSQRRPYHERQRSSGRDKRESPVIYKRIRILDDSESEEKESEHRSIHTRVEEIEHIRVEAIEKIEDETDENGSSFENPQKLADDVMERFETSKAARDVVCLLGQLSGAHNIQITQAQYTLIRDFLLVEISIDNANRAGALANMTVAEYDRMTKERDEFVVLVKNHKTVSTHGPARIVFSAKLKSWMDVFLREVRLKITASNTGPDNCVFITSTGEAMVSSQINKAIKSVWKKAEVEGAPSSTLFRKSAVSSVHSCSESNEARGNLADLMAHNVSTATPILSTSRKIEILCQGFPTSASSHARG